MKTVPELMEAAKKAEETPRQPGQVGTSRVDIEHLEQKTLVIRSKRGESAFEFLADEPPERGGLGRGPGPLAYFVSGAASCLLMKYADVVLAKDLPVDDLKMMARAHFQQDLPRRMQDMVVEIHVEGGISEEALRELAHEAGERCFVSNTLDKAIPITKEVYLNGTKALTIELGPDKPEGGLITS